MGEIFNGGDDHQIHTVNTIDLNTHQICESKNPIAWQIWHIMIVCRVSRPQKKTVKRSKFMTKHRSGVLHFRLGCWWSGSGIQYSKTSGIAKEDPTESACILKPFDGTWGHQREGGGNIQALNLITRFCGVKCDLKGWNRLKSRSGGKFSDFFLSARKTSLSDYVLVLYSPKKDVWFVLFWFLGALSIATAGQKRIACGGWFFLWPGSAKHFFPCAGAIISELASLVASWSRSKIFRCTWLCAQPTSSFSGFL